MSHNLPERDPRSRLEDEGIPDLQAGTPEQQWAVDPEEMPVPGDEPAAVDDFGTTADEQREGEPLDGRLDREEPEQQPILDGDRGAAVTASAAAGDYVAVAPGRSAAGTAGPQSESAEDVAATSTAGMDDTTPDGGLGPGSDLNTERETVPEADQEWPGQPEAPTGQIWDDADDRPAGRLVAPDEGAHEDAEADEVAREAGPDAGGYSAEESAMRVEPG